MKRFLILLIALLFLLTGCKPKHRRDSIGLDYLKETDFLDNCAIQELF